MFKLDKYDVSINIDLKNGIYIFDNISATGKTRLAKMLKQYESYGEPVTSYTYEDKQRNIPIDNVLKSNKYKLIALDRYDLYKGDGVELIKKCAKTSIILIDCKNDMAFTDIDDWCSIKMSPTTIEIEGYE